jgi:hypothetical protein
MRKEQNMKQQTEVKNCQLPCIPNFNEGYAEVPPESIKRKIRLLVRRSLNVRQVRIIKNKTSQWIGKLNGLLNKPNIAVEDNRPDQKIQAGDLVRIRSEKDIRSTLNVWGILKGCMFMPEMAKYCGTTQIVYKRLERFVDERDYHVKKSSGIVFLDGLHCEGTSDYGRCDRSCFYFWREEWLEKLEKNSLTVNPN